MNRQMEAFRNLDTSNPYANMENTMEDLTVNQSQAQMQNQQFQQSQANILDATRGASGGSGVAAIAQQLAQSGQLAAQQNSASIGAQESANQKATAAQASQIQNKKISGDIWSRGQKKEQVTTELGMAQQERAQYNQQAAAAQQAKMDGVVDGVTGAITSVTGAMESGDFDTAKPFWNG